MQIDDDPFHESGFSYINVLYRVKVSVDICNTEAGLIPKSAVLHGTTTKIKLLFNHKQKCTSVGVLHQEMLETKLLNVVLLFNAELIAIVLKCWSTYWKDTWVWINKSLNVYRYTKKPTKDN